MLRVGSPFVFSCKLDEILLKIDFIEEMRTNSGKKRGP